MSKERKRRKRVSSHPEVLVERARTARRTCAEYELDIEEVDALLEGAVTEVESVASRAQHELDETTKKLNGLTWRPPAPGPVEKLG